MKAIYLEKFKNCRKPKASTIGVASQLQLWKGNAGHERVSQNIWDSV